MPAATNMPTSVIATAAGNGGTGSTVNTKKFGEPLFGPSIGSVSSGPGWTASTEKKTVADELTQETVDGWIEKSKEVSHRRSCYDASGATPILCGVVLLGNARLCIQRAVILHAIFSNIYVCSLRIRQQRSRLSSILSGQLSVSPLFPLPKTMGLLPLVQSRSISMALNSYTIAMPQSVGSM